MKKTVYAIAMILIMLFSILCIIPVNALENSSSRITDNVCGLDMSDDESVYDYKKQAWEMPRYSVPSSVDLSQNNYFPPIGDQGEIGSCASWATVYYQYGYQVASMNNWDSAHDSSKRFSPQFVFNIVKNPYNNNYVSSISNNHTLLKKHGSVRYYEFEPSTTLSPSRVEVNEWYTDTDDLTNALKNRVMTSSSYIFASQEASTPINAYYSDQLNYIKYLLSNGKVLVFATHFGYSVNAQNTGYSCQGSTDWRFGWASNGDVVCVENLIQSDGTSTHAMAIVGYNDSIWYDYNSNGIQEDYELGAFKVANSWGTDYGNDGFIWVMYDAINKVSNCEVLQTPNRNRQPIFIDYKFYMIEVDSYDLDLVANVSLMHNNRNDINLDLGVNSLNINYPGTLSDTMFMNKGGNLPIDGINLNTAVTIPLDFGTIINGDRNRKNYFVKTIDSDQNNNGDYLTVCGVQIIDKSGCVVIDDTNTTYIANDNELRKYRIGLLGDVDNDTTVDTVDATLVQRILVALVEATDDDYRAADVDGNGVVNIFDVFVIQRYDANLPLPGFIENGYFCAGYYTDLDKEMI